MNLDEMAAKKSSFFSTGIKRKAEVVNLSPIACMKLLRLIKSLSWKVRQRRTFLHHGAWLHPALTAGQILNGIRYDQCFEGTEIVIVPDNDLPGEGYLNTIATGLRGKVKSLKVLRLPGLKEKEDIIDWVKRGGHA